MQDLFFVPVKHTGKQVEDPDVKFVKNYFDGFMLSEPITSFEVFGKEFALIPASCLCLTDVQREIDWKKVANINNKFDRGYANASLVSEKISEDIWGNKLYYYVMFDGQHTALSVLQTGLYDEYGENLVLCIITRGGDPRERFLDSNEYKNSISFENKFHAWLRYDEVDPKHKDADSIRNAQWMKDFFYNEYNITLMKNLTCNTGEFTGGSSIFSVLQDCIRSAKSDLERKDDKELVKCSNDKEIVLEEGYRRFKILIDLQFDLFGQENYMKGACNGADKGNSNVMRAFFRWLNTYNWFPGKRKRPVSSRWNLPYDTLLGSLSGKVCELKIPGRGKRRKYFIDDVTDLRSAADVVNTVVQGDRIKNDVPTMSKRSTDGQDTFMPPVLEEIAKMSHKY